MDVISDIYSPDSDKSFISVTSCDAASKSSVAFYNSYDEGFFSISSLEFGEFVTFVLSCADKSAASNRLVESFSI